MIDYEIKDDYKIIGASGSADGSQEKFFFENFWYKKNLNGYEGLSEELIYKVLHCSNIHNYAKYECCCINGRKGCRSENFLQGTQRLLTFQHLYEMHTGGRFIDFILQTQEIEKRVYDTIDIMYKYTGLDLTSYISNTTHLDALTLNTDRHFNNLAVVLGEHGYSEAPIFDNGDALLSNFLKFPPHLNLEEALDKVYAQPFSGSHFRQMSCLKNSLKINYKELYEILETYEASRALSVLKYQLNWYEDYFRDDTIMTAFNL